MKMLKQGMAALAAVGVLAVAASAEEMMTAVGEGEGVVDIVAWPGYIERGQTDPKFGWVSDFEAKTSCQVRVKTANTSDEMVALMNEGGFDLVTASGDASLRLISGKRVQPINTDLVRGRAVDLSDWRFAAADTVAAFGLHGAFLCGERRALRPEETSRWLANLAGFSATLQCDGGPLIRGRASDVLGGPVTALRHLVELVAGDPANPGLSAGEIITTGTVTRAMPIAPGEVWRTTLEDIPLDGLVVRFV